MQQVKSRFSRIFFRPIFVFYYMKSDKIYYMIKWFPAIQQFSNFIQSQNTCVR